MNQVGQKKKGSFIVKGGKRGESLYISKRIMSGLKDSLRTWGKGDQGMRGGEKCAVSRGKGRGDHFLSSAKIEGCQQNLSGETVERRTSWGGAGER